MTSASRINVGISASKSVSVDCAAWIILSLACASVVAPAFAGDRYTGHRERSGYEASAVRHELLDSLRHSGASSRRGQSFSDPRRRFATVRSLQEGQKMSPSPRTLEENVS